MPSPTKIPSSRDKLLFTPGPLTTSLSVKQAMLHDAGSWHSEFNELVGQIREKILGLAGVSRALGYEAIPMQGTGTFGVEAVFATAIPADGKVLILANGAYGERMAQMATHLRLKHSVLRCPENATPDLTALDRALGDDETITHVAVVHCETTTGILNPIHDIGRIVRAAGCLYIVDAMSSFGALPINIVATGIDYLISSANKCLEGVPGFSFVIARRAPLLAAEGSARSLSLDLLGQLKGFEKNGQFRYTPPTHSILAFAQALEELEAEGGIPARGARYRRNHELLVAGMRQLGFRVYLETGVQSCIITAFHFPDDPRFTFGEFYNRLSEKGFIIYPGKISQVDLFRIGSVGRIFERDVRSLLGAIAETVGEMNLRMHPAPENHPAAPPARVEAAEVFF